MRLRNSAGSALRSAILLAAVFGLVLLFAWWRLHSQDAVVVYCAHDAVYAKDVLQKFQEETGIRVIMVFDTEATKSLALAEMIKQERSAPRCDVFWNNELLGTLDLKEAGLLEAYTGSGWERMPSTFKDPDGLWTGFGARMRVLLAYVSPNATPDLAEVDALEEQHPGQVGMAMPLYGTTLTHYAVLARSMGLEALKTWHKRKLAQGRVFLPGNGAVKDAVARGQLPWGYTDTDDALVALRDQQPVKMFPVRVQGKTIAIPNTVSMIKGCAHPEEAKRLIDYLLSESNERALAEAAGQIPLGPVDLESLPENVREFTVWARDGAELHDLSGLRNTLTEWLKSSDSREPGR